MARWYEGNRWGTWRITYVKCSNCGYKANQLSATCPNCKEKMEHPSYMANGNKCVLDEKMMKFARAGDM